jgi:excinuclease ABC subunit A
MPFEGMIPALQRRYRETSSSILRERIEALMSERTCDACDGKRLRPESLAVTLDDHSIVEVSDWTLTRLHSWLAEMEARPGDGPLGGRTARTIAAPILREMGARLEFLTQVGLEYLTLSRPSATLSGGEAQRIRMATQIGSRLSGVLYVLDEPSVGLHPRDTDRLVAGLRQMRDLGNTVLVVEHDLAIIRSCDWVIDLGPGAGPAGGHLVGEGPPEKLARNPRSLTGRYLAGRLQAKVPGHRRPGNGKYLTVVGARANNLKNLTVQIPLGQLVCITGVSGSGKSTLLLDVLSRGLASPAGTLSGRSACDRIEGAGEVKKVIDIDQTPIGRTPRSNPATYVGLYGEIRDLFAALPGSKVRGYRPGRFSFNVRGGRCEACEGQGQIQVSMQFLPDVYVPCEVCNGARFNRETLQVQFKGKNISEILETTVEEARETFKAFPNMVRKLDTLFDVGLGYIRLGQPAPTLSGGEAQRVKLARELSRKASGHTLYILDEPTVGLHAADVLRLISVLNRLVDEGHTVAVIEHNLDVIKVADHIIDLGPEGGDAGGEVVAQGTPEEVARSPHSHTGRYLREVLHPQTSPSGSHPKVRRRKAVA